MKKTSVSMWTKAFLSGEATDAAEILGSHLTAKGAVFRVWAPDAESVSVVAEFNSWDGETHKMRRLEGGIWERRIAGAKAGDCYKYLIRTHDGRELWKADPYAFHAELRPNTASKIYDLGGFNWSDGEWLARRRENKVYSAPMSAYEVHPGSWRRHEDGSFLTYRELARELVPYVKSLGFTHIELMPVTEHPYDGSWGYQCTGYFAATSRYGEPRDLMYFINYCHKRGIGVIMDWTPAHFPKDAHGLVEFDGTRLYEHPDSVRGEHPSWGTRIFDYGRGEIRSFLISSALFWLREYHVDGIRVDAVASMLYLDYDRHDGNRITNQYGGRENLEAVEFIKRLNMAAFAYDDSVLMIAEESTAWPGVTMPVHEGGLGFNLKWNMGWMNDILDYVKLDPYFRAGSHKNITFSFMYAFSENYLLPISHDEVVHLKGSLYSKMPGDAAMKCSGVRSFWSYMLAHPGKKLLFMGSELGQETEWDYEAELPFEGLETEEKSALHEFFKAAGKFYQKTPELWEVDFSPEGFRWICPDETMRNVVGFIRRDSSDNELIFICNFSGATTSDFRMGLPGSGKYRVEFSSDERKFGGTGNLIAGAHFKAEKAPWHGDEYSAVFELPPLSAVFLRRSGKRNARNEE